MLTRHVQWDRLHWLVLLILCRSEHSHPPPERLGSLDYNDVLKEHFHTCAHSIKANIIWRSAMGLVNGRDKTICMHLLRRMYMCISSQKQIPILTPWLTPPASLWGHSELLQFLQASPVPGPRKGVNLMSLAWEPGQIFLPFCSLLFLTFCWQIFFCEC